MARQPRSSATEEGRKGKAEGQQLLAGFQQPSVIGPPSPFPLHPARETTTSLGMRGEKPPEINPPHLAYPPKGKNRGKAGRGEANMGKGRHGHRPRIYI